MRRQLTCSPDLCQVSACLLCCMAPHALPLMHALRRFDMKAKQAAMLFGAATSAMQHSKPSVGPGHKGHLSFGGAFVNQINGLHLTKLIIVSPLSLIFLPCSPAVAHKHKHPC